MRTVYLALIMIFAAAAATEARAEVKTPLPKSVEIAKPAAGVPAARARYAGVWSGALRRTWRHTLVVQRITKSGADVIVSWGKRGRTTAGWQRARGQFSKGVLWVWISKPFGGRSLAVAYVLRRDGIMEVSYQPLARCGRTQGALKRIAGPGDKLQVATHDAGTKSGGTGCS